MACSPGRNGHRARPLSWIVMRLPRGCAPIAVAAAVTAMAGCSFLDRREEIAYRTLIAENGAFDEPSYSAAITVKFPTGSAVDNLRKYVSDSGGECYTRETGYWCEIAYLAGYCYAAMIGIEIKTQGAVIESTRVKIGGLGC